jgi:hypothetical protein
MSMRCSVLALFMLVALGAAAVAAQGMRFWNLTSFTVYRLQLAPAGTQAWGPNQCDNDADKSVDPDERLKVVGVAPGRYDVRLADKKGRLCLARYVEVKSGGAYAFSVSDKDLTDCSQ